VKAETCGDEPEQRARAEAQVIGCSDAILASTGEERAQLERLYAAPSERVEIVSPGVDHRTFSPGPRAAARAVLGLGDGPVLLFVGRIQRLKGADVAVRALAHLHWDHSARGVAAQRTRPGFPTCCRSAPTDRMWTQDSQSAEQSLQLGTWKRAAAEIRALANSHGFVGTVEILVEAPRALRRRDASSNSTISTSSRSRGSSADASAGRCHDSVDAADCVDGRLLSVRSLQKAHCAQNGRVPQALRISPGTGAASAGSCCPSSGPTFFGRG